MLLKPFIYIFPGGQVLRGDAPTEYDLLRARQGRVSIIDSSASKIYPGNGMQAGWTHLQELKVLPSGPHGEAMHTIPS